MRPTLKDIALRADVSYQTVWRALHNATRIHPATRDHVLEVANALGYRPNRLAIGLRTNRSRAIGLVLPDVKNPVLAEITSGVENEATRRGYSVLLMNSYEDRERERRAVGALLERQVDGLILTPTRGEHAWLRHELPPRFPLVALIRPMPEVPCGTVLLHNRAAARAATAHLIAKGHDRIGAIFASLEFATFRERYEGFRDALRAHSLPLRPGWIRIGEHRVETGYDAVIELFGRRDRPSALFAASGRLTEGALLALRRLGLRQGCDVAVVGYDLSYAGLLDPPLPVVIQPNHESGRGAVAMLLDLVEGRVSKSPRLRLPLTLVLDHDSRPAEMAVPGQGG